MLERDSSIYDLTLNRGNQGVEPSCWKPWMSLGQRNRPAGTAHLGGFLVQIETREGLVREVPSPLHCTLSVPDELACGLLP